MRADMKTDYKGADVQGAGHQHMFSLMFSLNQRDNFTYFFVSVQCYKDTPH